MAPGFPAGIARVTGAVLVAGLVAALISGLMAGVARLGTVIGRPLAKP